MRKLEILAALSAIILASSCSKDETPGYLSDPDSVRVEAVVGPLTRSNPVGTPEEQAVFNEGDRIGISNGGDFVNYVLRDGSWVPDDPSRYLKWESGSMTFKAYYPANNASSFETGDVYTNQDEESSLRYSDYMTAEVTADKPQAGNSLSLRMERRTARVVVSIDSFRDEFAGTNPAVSAVKVHSSSKVPYSDLSSPVPIESFNKDGKFYALVCPNEARPDQTFLELTVEYGDPKQTKTLTVKGVPAMEAGKSYTYSVIVGKTSVKVGSVSVKDWTTGEAIDDGLTESILAWSGKAAPFAMTDAYGNALGDSEITPILIENAEQLAYLAEQVNAGNSYMGKYFRLTTEINLLRRPWTSIGGLNKNFSGNFDGGYKKIYGLKVNATAGYGGLFGSVTSAGIKKVTIESADINVGETQWSAAVLCAYASHATIEDCSVSGSVDGGGYYVGGVIGYLVSSRMEYCSAEVTVKGKSQIGGVCGIIGNGSTLTGCSAINSHLEGETHVGGVVGRLDQNEKGCLYDCWTTGVVKGTESVGGIVGAIGFSHPEVSRCSADVDITVSGSKCGGLVGTVYNCNGKFIDCSFDGVITKDGSETKLVGAVVGEDASSATFTNCWYNADKTEDLPAVDRTKEGKDYSGITAKNLGK